MHTFSGTLTNQPCSSTLGKYSCVGKQLALMEIRDVASQLARRYDIRLADGQTSQSFEQGLIDSFTLTTPELRLVFTARNASVPS